jgi:phosphoribosylformylglycinamidine (FGAM) synthase-like amidotransferase family enzyme
MPSGLQLSREELLAAYRRMRTIRDFEDRVHEEFSAGAIPGFVHLYAGEEASAVGVCMHLDERDAIASTHRGHGHSIAKGWTHNDGGRFEDRWAWLKVDQASPCIFTRGLDQLYLPVRHGEGKFVTANDAILQQLEDRHLTVVKYADSELNPTMDYPANPNGSINAIAGICDPTGRLFGLMPHPEAYVHYTHHPRWTRGNLPEEGMGLWLYQNAVQFIREEL